MNTEDMSVEHLHDNSFPLELEYTLGELEWQKLVGPSGLGRELLQGMSDLGGDVIQFSSVRHRRSTEADVFEFSVAGEHVRVHLDYDVPYTASLLRGVRALLDDVNRALRRASSPWRYVCVRRQASPGSYRIALLHSRFLDGLDRDFQVIAGLTPEDYESSSVVENRAMH